MVLNLSFSSAMPKKSEYTLNRVQCQRSVFAWRPALFGQYRRCMRLSKYMYRAWFPRISRISHISHRKRTTCVARIGRICNFAHAWVARSCSTYSVAGWPGTACLTVRGSDVMSPGPCVQLASCASCASYKYMCKSFQANM